MFFHCYSLISLSIDNETNLNNSNLPIYITKINNLFCGCKSLISLPNVSNWNISIIKDMS